MKDKRINCCVPFLNVIFAEINTSVDRETECLSLDVKCIEMSAFIRKRLLYLTLPALNHPCLIKRLEAMLYRNLVIIICLGIGPGLTFFYTWCKQLSRIILITAHNVQNKMV